MIYNLLKTKVSKYKIEDTNWVYKDKLETLINSILQEIEKNPRDWDNIVKMEVKEINKYYKYPIFSIDTDNKIWINGIIALIIENEKSSIIKVRREINYHLLCDLLYSNLRSMEKLNFIYDVDEIKIKKRFRNEFFDWPILNLSIRIAKSASFTLIIFLCMIFLVGLKLYTLLIIYLLTYLIYNKFNNTRITNFINIDYEIGVLFLIQLLKDNGCYNVSAVDSLIQSVENDLEYHSGLKSNIISSFIIGAVSVFLSLRLLYNPERLVLKFELDDFIFGVVILIIIFMLSNIIIELSYNPKKDRFYYDCLRKIKFRTLINR